MNTRKIMVLLAIALMATNLTQAQDKVSRDTEMPQIVYISNYFGTSGIYVDNAGKRSQPKFTGSVYMDTNFRPGVLAYNDTAIFKQGAYRLNTQVNQMEIKYDGQVNSISLPDFIDSLCFNDHKFVFRVINKDGVGKKVWVEELYNGDVKLYRFYFSYLEKEMHRLAMDVGSGQLRMVQDNTLYIQFGNKQAVELPEYRRRASRLFINHENEVLKFMKKEKLKTKEPEEVIKIIAYYNSLDK